MTVNPKKLLVKKDNFEQLIKRLEEIVSLLEKGDVPLDESIKLFEEGIKISKKCSDKLAKVEQKVKVIIGVDNDKLITEDFQE
jgi:exodeoxyribonuclease VII small subunit